MTDRDPLTERLAELREPEGISTAAPAAVRARGDRIRRRRYAAGTAGAVLAVAAVAVPLGVLAAGGERTAPAPAERPSESAPAEPAPSDASGGTVVTSLPEGFPLGAGWPRAGGDVSLTGPSASAPSVVARACGRRSGAPPGSLDRVAAGLRSPAESRGREVLLYPTTEAAAEASAELRTVFADCPRDADTGIPVDYVTTVTDEGLGDEAWVARSSFANPAQPGRSVFVAVRSGNALLLESVSDEGTDADELAAEVLGSLVAPYDALAHLAPPAPAAGSAAPTGPR